MSNRLYFSVCLCLFSVGTFYAQSLTREEFEDSIQKNPSFSIHEDNYFITGIPTNKNINGETADAKYQISFKQLLFRNKLPLDTYLFLKYTQKAFWNIYQFSSPFEEINFNPGIGLGKVFYGDEGRASSLGVFMLEHESNGRDSIYSRSWNKVSVAYHTAINRKMLLSLKAWLPFKYKDDNPDILDYMGYGELALEYEFKHKELYADVHVRKGTSGWKGNVRTRVLYNPFNASNQYLVLEWYAGYGESLIDFDQYRSMLRIGFVIKSNELDFLQK